MSLQSKRELLEALRDPYESASYSGRQRLLDGFQAAINQGLLVLNSP
jgi:hypothetical protein